MCHPQDLLCGVYDLHDAAAVAAAEAAIAAGPGITVERFDPGSSSDDSDSDSDSICEHSSEEGRDALHLSSSQQAEGVGPPSSRGSRQGPPAATGRQDTATPMEVEGAAAAGTGTGPGSNAQQRQRHRKKAAPGLIQEM
jgi:hypothetical protein